MLSDVALLVPRPGGRADRGTGQTGSGPGLQCTGRVRSTAVPFAYRAARRHIFLNWRVFLGQRDWRSTVLPICAGIVICVISVYFSARLAQTRHDEYTDIDDGTCNLPFDANGCYSCVDGSTQCWQAVMETEFSQPAAPQVGLLRYCLTGDCFADAAVPCSCPPAVVDRKRRVPRAPEQQPVDAGRAKRQPGRAWRRSRRGLRAVRAVLHRDTSSGRWRRAHARLRGCCAVRGTNMCGRRCR